MASWTQQHPQHDQEQQQQHHQQRNQQQELPMPQQNDQMQYQDMNSYLNPQQHVQQINTMSPTNLVPLDQNQGLMITMSPQQQQTQNQMMHQTAASSMSNQDMCNQQPTTQNQIHPQQKSHLLPLLLSPRPASLKVERVDHSDQVHQPDIDHNQIIEQVMSLENEYSDQSSAMTNFDNNAVIMMGQEQQQQHMGDSSLSDGICMQNSNQLSSSSEEDLLKILLEINRDSSNILSSGVQQLDQDEKVGIETIRKQLMSCEVHSDQMIDHDGMSSPFDQMSSGSQSQVGTVQQLPHNQILHGVQQQQLISQTAPVITDQQPQHQLSPGLIHQRQQQLPQHHRLSVDQTLLHGSYSNTHRGNGVNVSSSGQTCNHQQHQNIARITQSTPMSMDSNSPSPSWQQPQLSPYSPQNELVRPPPQRHTTLHHPIQPHHISTTSTTTTSPQMQQLHHPSSQTRSQSQSISPPAKSEPSPVVKKNPLLNAQLVNSPGPSVTLTRFINNQTSVLNQNPILNSKLSHGQVGRQRSKQQHQSTSLLKQLLSDDK